MELAGDRAFDPEVTKKHPGASIWPALKLELERRGLGIAAADLVEERSIGPATLLLSHGWSPLSARLIRRGAIAAVVTSFESPVIAWSFYHRLTSISNQYRHAFLFPGAGTRSRARNGSSPMFVPQPRREVLRTEGQWADRDFLTVVAANKTLEPVSVRGLLRAVAARFFSTASQAYRPSIRRQLVCLRDRQLGRELYSERQRAIRYFLRRDDFRIFGHGWDRKMATALESLGDQLIRHYGGPVDDKWYTLSQYRFSLCFENAEFPGYITEKIFDCFFTGCIPIYLGAPDVACYIPSGAYVDVRRFGNYSALETYLANMTSAEARGMLAAASEFLGSSQFDVFYDRYAAQAMARELVAAAGI